MVALPNFNPVEGLTTDAAGALTHEGQLRQINANTALHSGLHATNGTAALAAAIVDTGIDLPAGEKLYAMTFALTGAAGAQWGMLCLGVTGVGITYGLMVSTPSAANSLSFQPEGFDYGVNKRIFIFTNVAANIAAFTMFTAVGA